MYHLFLFSGGFLIGLVVAIPVGPVNLICIRRTLSYGTWSGFLSGLGGALGDGVFAAVTAFGLTAISQLIEGYSRPLQLMGGIMLLGFGLTVFQTDVSSLRDAEGAPVRKQFLQPGSIHVIAQISYIKFLTHDNTPTIQSNLRTEPTQSDFPGRTERDQHGGPPSGPAKEKGAGRLQKNACYDRVVKPTCHTV